MTLNKKYDPNSSGDLFWSKNISRVYCKEAYLTPLGRISFPKLVEAQEREWQGKKLMPKFEVAILLDKEDADVVKFQHKILLKSKAMVALYNEKNSADKPKLGDLDAVFKDGDKANLEKYPSQEGQYIIVARNKERPDILGPDGKNLDPAEVEAGMIVKMFITPSFGSTGISYQIEALQVVEDDGVRFGGSRPDYKSLLQEINESTEGSEEGLEETGAVNPDIQEPKTVKSAAEVKVPKAAETPTTTEGPVKKLTLAEQAKARAEASAQAKKDPPQAVRRVIKVQKGISAAKSLL